MGREKPGFESKLGACQKMIAKPRFLGQLADALGDEAGPVNGVGEGGGFAAEFFQALLGGVDFGGGHGPVVVFFFDGVIAIRTFGDLGGELLAVGFGLVEAFVS